MKLKVKFSGAAIGQFFAENGEKLILLATVIVLLMFAYGAITAKPLDSSTPSQISSESKSAQDRVNAVAWDAADGPSKDPSLKAPNFAAAVDKAGEQVELARLELNRAWDPPLFPELTKRADPEIFPVQDLRVSAGFGLVLYQNAAPVAAPGAAGPAAAPGGRPLVIPGPPPGIFGPGGPYGPTNSVSTEVPRIPSQNQNLPGPRPSGQGFEAKPRHYVVVTGVVPLEKQVAEYRRRFEYAVRDPSGMADSFNPRYIFFYVERPEAASPSEPVANLQWKKLDYKQLLTDQSQWLPVSTGQSEVIDPKYAFPPGYGTYSHFLTWPLPPILLRNWGLDATHPKVGLLKPAEAEAQPDSKGQESIDPLAGTQNNQFAPGVPNFGGPPPGMGGPPQMFGPPRNFGGPPGMYGPAAADQTPTVPQRLFRFVDLTTEPGKIYRYRVQLVLDNPNYNYPAQYLEKAESAKNKFATSPKSDATAAIQVPPEAAALVEGISTPRGEPTAKLNMWAVLKDPAVEVLTSSEQTSLLLAGVAHFRDVAIKNVTDMATDQVRSEVKADNLNANDALLLDVRNDNPLGMSSRSKGPAEMLFMDPSGRLTVANSAVDGIKSADYHRRTDMPAPPPPEKGAAANPGVPPGAQGGPPPGIFGPGPAARPR